MNTYVYPLTPIYRHSDYVCVFNTYYNRLTHTNKIYYEKCKWS